MKKSSKIYIGIAIMFGIAGIAVAVAVVFAFMNPVEPVDVTFDKDFIFGAASASYQIEGGWEADGKSCNIWDTVTHNDWNYTADRSNGDVAANSYEFYEKDIEALDNIGVSEYSELEQENCTLFDHLLSLT